MTAKEIIALKKVRDTLQRDICDAHECAEQYAAEEHINDVCEEAFKVGYLKTSIELAIADIDSLIEGATNEM